MAAVKLEDPLLCAGDNLQQVCILGCKRVSYCISLPGYADARRIVFDTHSWGGSLALQFDPLRPSTRVRIKTRSLTYKAHVNQSGYATPSLSDFLVVSGYFETAESLPKGIATSDSDVCSCFVIRHLIRF
jgi:hypothetical protein